MTVDDLSSDYVPDLSFCFYRGFGIAYPYFTFHLKLFSDLLHFLNQQYLDEEFFIDSYAWTYQEHPDYRSYPNRRHVC